MTKYSIRPAASAFLLVLTMSLISTALSFFVVPVCTDMGFGRGSFMVYYSLMVASGAFNTSLLGAYMNRRGVRGVVLVSAVWCCVSAWGLSLASSLWMFYLVGAAMGFFGSACVYLAANVIVQHSYTGSEASAVLGVVMTGSGIGGVIWSNVFPRLIDSMGWRVGYRVLGVCWLALALLAVLILGRRQLSAAAKDAKAAEAGAPKGEAFRSPRFALVVMVMCELIIASCVAQHLPSLLGGMGYGTGQISLMISVMTAFSVLSTVAEGFVCSRLGIRRTLTGVLVIFAVGCCLLALGAWVYPALVCLTFGFGAVSTLMPIVVRQIFGGRDYTAIWSVVLTCGSVTSFVANPVWGMVYDVAGSYGPALTVMPVLLAAAIPAVLAALRKRTA